MSLSYGQTCDLHLVALEQLCNLSSAINLRSDMENCIHNNKKCSANPNSISISHYDMEPPYFFFAALLLLYLLIVERTSGWYSPRFLAWLV